MVEIEKTRAKFRDQILKLEQKIEKTQKVDDKTSKDHEEYKREVGDLQEYQESYKTRIEGYQRELKEMDDYEKYL